MITIYGTLYSSKNHRQLFKNKSTGKMFIAKPKKAKEAEDGLMIQLKSNIRKWREMKTDQSYQPSLTPLTQNDSHFVGRLQGIVEIKKDFPLRVQFKIYRKNKQRFDYVNIIQSLADQMVKAGYLPDDSADYFIPVFEPYEVDPKNPRTEIIIL